MEVKFVVEGECPTQDQANYGQQADTVDHQWVEVVLVDDL